jgi:hypothetical protein
MRRKQGSSPADRESQQRCIRGQCVRIGAQQLSLEVAVLREHGRADEY